MNCNIKNLIYCLRNFFWYDAVNEIVTMFDECAKKEVIEKINTIGDAYLESIQETSSEA